MIEIHLLGQFDLRLDGQSVEIPSRPAQSLLAYLALTVGVAHRRERLAGLIWPDIPEAEARRNLRRALWHIRKAAEHQAPLRADDLTVSFDARPDIWVDALVISQKLSVVQDVDKLLQVVSAYGGELLPGFYDEWIIVERERLQAAFESRIRLLLDCLVKTHRWVDVFEWGEKWIALTGPAEPAYRALMTAYAGQGDLAGVGHTYQRCVEALSRDLGVEPSNETRQLFRLLSRPGQVQAPATAGPPVQDYKIENAPAVTKEPSNQSMSLVEPSEPGADKETAARPPFKGLQYFDEADARLFFGREALTARLLERLGVSANSQRDGDNLLVIVGASGSGKSSLVRAGLVPALRQHTSSGALPGSRAAWEIAVITPSAHPVEALAACLTRNMESVTAAATLVDDMRSDPRSLRLYLHKLASPLFLVVDQMEELFTLCRDESERQAFVDNLLAATEGDRCKVVLTLRADFYAHCARFEALRIALADCQEYIGPMNAAELRRAIEAPAETSGYTFETGLVDLLLREVGNEPGSLPLLSHALLETWKRRQDHTLTLAGYAESGGVHGAIARTAESLYSRLAPQQQRVARSILLRLTELGEGVQDTRRRVVPSELILRAEDHFIVDEVLNLLAEARLITIGEGAVEVAHEALIREWPTLRLWLSEDREGLRLHRRLTEAARSWEELDCDPGELYRGGRLSQAVEWSAGHADELNDLERDFLAASQALSEQEIAEREAARQREIEATRRFAESEQSRAEEQSRAAQKFRWLAAGLALLLLAAVALASSTLQQRDRAAAQARLAISRELAASALSNLGVDPERSILLALQALKNNNSREAEDALHQSVQASRLIKVIKTHNQWATRVAVSPDGLRLAVTSVSPSYIFETEIFDIASGERLLILPGGLAADFWPDSRRLATVVTGMDGKGVITMWDARSGQALSTLPRDFPFPQGVVNGTFNPDWTLVAEALTNGTTIVTRLDNGDRLLTLGKPGIPPTGALDFSPDGKRLLAMTDNRLRIWDVSSGKELVTLPSSEFGVTDARFAPKQDKVALGMGSVVKIVDASTGQTLLTLSGHTGFVQGLRYNWKGSLLATAGSDGRAIIWDTATGRALITLAGHSGALADIAFLPTGDHLATSSFDGTVRIWDISPAGDSEGASSYDFFGRSYTGIAFNPDGTRLAVSGGSNTGEILDAATGQRLLSLGGKFGNWQGSAAFSPDGRRLALTSGEDVATIWDADNGQLLLTLQGHRAWIGDLAFSPDGKRLATIGFDGSAKIWEAASGREYLTVQAFTETLDNTEVMGIDFSPDGSRFATAAGRTPKVWDAATGEELLVLPPQPENVYAVAFSPDGKRLAIGAALGTGANIWDSASGQKLVQLSGHQGSVQAILFSRDGEQVYTGSVDGTVKVWDAATGQEQLTFARQSAQITGLALSPDGKRLAASSDNGTLRVYLLKIDDLVQYALGRLTRWLTPEECQAYLHTETCPARP